MYDRQRLVECYSSKPRFPIFNSQPVVLRYLFQSKHRHWFPVDTINCTFYPVADIGILHDTQGLKSYAIIFAETEKFYLDIPFFVGPSFPLPDRDNSFPFLYFCMISDQRSKLVRIVCTFIIPDTGGQ